MMLPLLLAAVAPTSTPPAENVSQPDGPETLKINILVKQPAPECEPSDGDEIVVCAEPEDQERYRLRPIPNADQFEQGESKAEFDIAENVQMAGETEYAVIGPGVPSNRLMVRLKIGF